MSDIEVKYDIVLNHKVFISLVSLIVNHSIKDVSSNLLTTFFLCAGAGMLGGMLS